MILKRSPNQKYRVKGGSKWGHFSTKELEKEIEGLTREQIRRKSPALAREAKKRDIWPPKSTGKSQIKWTEEKVRAAVLGAKTRSEILELYGGSVYQAIRRLGLYEELVGSIPRVGSPRKGIKVPRKWTDREIRKAAEPYNTLQEFRIGNNKGYQAAKRHGILHDLGLETNRWTDDEIKAEVAKYADAESFKAADYTNYEIARKRGFVEALPVRHKVHVYSEEQVRDHFASIKSYSEIDWGIRQAAVRLGLFEELTEDLEVGKSGFDPSKPAYLYYLRVDSPISGTIYKIGITNRRVQQRFSADDLTRIRILKRWYYERGAEARRHEQRLKREFSEFQYEGPPVLDSGNTELFTRDILKLDHDSQ